MIVTVISAAPWGCFQKLKNVQGPLNQEAGLPVPKIMADWLLGFSRPSHSSLRVTLVAKIGHG